MDSFELVVSSHFYRSFIVTESLKFTKGVRNFAKSLEYTQILKHINTWLFVGLVVCVK